MVQVFGSEATSTWSMRVSDSANRACGASTNTSASTLRGRESTDAVRIGRGVSAGNLARREPFAGVTDLAEAVESERAPIGSAEIPRDEVPEVSGREQLVRFHESLVLVAVSAAVVEPDLLVGAAGRGERTERAGVDDTAVAVRPLQRCHALIECHDTTAEAVGQ